MTLLYKYLSDDNFRKYLKMHLDGKVYLSKWCDFNDPMEGFFVYVANRDPRHVIDAIVGTKAKYRVCCFSKSYNKFLLWSHYTNKHRGVCLEYEISEQHLPQQCTLDPIKYSGKLPHYDNSLSDDEQAKMFLLTKMMPWKEEEEVRLLGRNLTQDTVSFGRLTGIVFGVNYDKGDPKDKTRQYVVYECRAKGANAPKLYQASIDGDIPVITRRIFDRYDQNQLQVS